MADPRHSELPVSLQKDDELAAAKANIEHFLNNHTRNGGLARQQNMAARPGSWQIIAKTDATQPTAHTP